MSLALARRARVIARLDAHGLPVVYGGPDVIGSSCPLCPGQLGPFGTRYIAEAMVVEFNEAGNAHIVCCGGCSQREVMEALRAQPQRRREVAA